MLAVHFFDAHALAGLAPLIFRERESLMGVWMADEVYVAGGPDKGRVGDHDGGSLWYQRSCLGGWCVPPMFHLRGGTFFSFDEFYPKAVRLA